MFKIRRYVLCERIIYHLLLFFISLFCFVSCDGAARIRGKLSSTNTTDITGCYLKVFIHENNSLIYNFEIEKDFDVDFTISPWAKEYYMKIECDEHVTYKTKVYKMGGSRYLENPLDLGKITLIKK